MIDNLGSRKGADVLKAIDAEGATLLYLLPTVPTEKAFSKLKALLRKAAERTVDARWVRIGALLIEFTPHERTNYFIAAGNEPLREVTALDSREDVEHDEAECERHHEVRTRTN